MKRVFLLGLVAPTILTGCALTHDQVVERARAKSNTELCMNSLQFPQYGDVIAAELARRGHSCDWQQASAQVQTAATNDANRRAALQALTSSFNTQSTYQVQQPKLPTLPQLAPAPAISALSATAYFTGQQKQVQTVTYQYGWYCEYRYLTQTFWRTFVGTCPATVQVQ
ncbi:hypothetical protein [Massilia varians]|uniref:hypothetical protein n=1 Tax=Massilia varians TaxID=457921 RepID=UPI002552E7D6|nr:hypothetical protein [Massilia varians]MDK6077915.1 hypothetical protein [Massilia varians]